LIPRRLHQFLKPAWNGFRFPLLESYRSLLATGAL
jgi:hypothetical protein